MAENKGKTRKYDAENIVVLEGLEPVRKRPGMYIGSTGVEGLHHLLIEIFDNARDEAMNGACDEIEVALLPGDVVRVTDNGAGIPVEIHKKTTGTIITFKPDRQVFSELAYNFEKIITRMREQAYLVKKLRIRVMDLREYQGKIKDTDIFFLEELELQVPSKTFYFEGGLLSLIKFYNIYEKPVHNNIFYVEKELSNKMIVEIALQYVDDINSREISFANNTSTPEGGMHITGFRTALTRVLNDYAKKNGGLKDGDSFTGDDV